ncbi:hypothetical protein HZS_4660 [Henneguya salminicola]|nr:hypothetical protein HZS_4660 [Henneguya salminicola]
MLVLAMIEQFLKILYTLLDNKINKVRAKYNFVDQRTNIDVSLGSVWIKSRQHIGHFGSWYKIHLLRSLLFIVRFVISYFVMLAAMSFSFMQRCKLLLQLKY